MCEDIDKDVSFSVKRGLYTSTKSIDPDEPAQFEQADLGKNLLLLVDFLHNYQMTFLLIHLVI